MTGEGKYRNLNAMNEQTVSDRLLERLIRYTARGTPSDQDKADQGIFPSTDTQKEFARELKRELEERGLGPVTITDDFYVLAFLKASPGCEEKPSFGLCAHMDTAHDAPGENVHPQVHRNWDGQPIKLQDGYILDPARDSELEGCRGDTIITSDGTTLLGADDKAGIAGILTAMDYLTAHPEIQHGPIELLFSPDEETGHGMDRVPLKLLRSKAFYTVDGGQEGELEAECFNAWKTDITFHGISAHLGSARGKMVNAVTMAARFIASLPQTESPEATDGYDGYFCPLDIRGGPEKALVTIFLRDFDIENMQRRLARLKILAEAVTAAFPGSSLSIVETKQYLNMKEKLDAEPLVLDRLFRAAQKAGITPFLKPIRGGTDGSRLTEMGIPTPNIFTGGHNYHSRTEWASLRQMTKMVFTLIELARIWAE